VVRQRKEENEFVDSTVLEALGQKQKKVGCVSHAAKYNTGMKHAKFEPSGVINQPNSQVLKTSCI
jgi:hypothetical protein